MASNATQDIQKMHCYLKVIRNHEPSFISQARLTSAGVSQVKTQNLRLLESMENSTQLQLRLQALVEGLSIIADAYYLAELIGYMVKGASAFPSGAQSDLIIGTITLAVVLVIWGFVHYLRKKVMKDSD